MGLDSYTKALFHFDDDLMVDASGHISSVSVYGDAAFSTVQKKFGAGSLALDGSGDYLSFASSADFQFGNGAFTIDFWVRWSGGAHGGCLTDKMDTGSGQEEFEIYLANDGSIEFTEGTYGGSQATISSPAGAISADGAFHHIAAVRDATKIYLFLDGVSQATPVTAVNITATTAVVRIGGDPATNYVAGYMDEFRISKGIARWTGNFTPPTVPYGKFIPRLMMVAGEF